MPYDRFGHFYTIRNTGVNAQGNFYMSFDFGPNAPNKNAYCYFNKDGSYYYFNRDGSTYYNNGQGFAKYTSPPEKGYYWTALNGNRTYTQILQAENLGDDFVEVENVKDEDEDFLVVKMEDVTI